MKKSIKKTFKRTLIGSAALMGILVSGGNSASADYTDTYLYEAQFFAPFKDANGDRVSLNQEYYMEPVDFPGHGLKFEQWSTNEWAKLGSGRGMTVKFENVLYDPLGLNSSVKIRTDRNRIDADDADIGAQIYIYYKYLGLGFNSPGVEIEELKSDRKNQYWKPIQSRSPELASTNTIAFKNEENNEFLAYRNSNAWLYVDEPTINSKTKWRLIPKH
ncbi:hypothetical protein CON37_01960 [Bacillus cereus]|nr:hypothetical protein CON37_01960 [Bacillus cereus]